MKSCMVTSSDVDRTTDTALSERSQTQQHDDYIHINVPNRQKQLVRWKSNSCSLWGCGGKWWPRGTGERPLTAYILIWMMVIKVWLVHKNNWAEHWRFYIHINIFVRHYTSIEKLKKKQKLFQRQRTYIFFLFHHYIKMTQVTNLI